MQKEYLTQEEKELVELLIFMQKFFRNFPAIHPKDKEEMPKLVAIYEQEEEIITSFAKDN